MDMGSPAGQQLAMLRDLLRKQQGASIRTVSIIAGTLVGEPSRSIAEARTATLHWVKNRSGPLPKEAWDGAPFEVSAVGQQPVRAVRLVTPVEYWAVQAHDQDKTVAGRSWVTEVSLANVGGKAMLGVRLTCVSRHDDPPFVPTIPGLVHQIADRIGIGVDGTPAQSTAWTIADDTQFQQLVALLLARGRRLPVFVVSVPPDSGACAIDADVLAKAVRGVAHVVILPAALSWSLTTRFGKEFSVFNGAVRTYRPGFDPDRDEPFSHPLALPTRILDWEGGAAGYTTFLAENAIHASTRQKGVDELVPSYDLVRRRFLQQQQELARAGGAAESTIIAMQERQIEQLREDIESDHETYQSYVDGLEADLHSAQLLINELEAREHHLLARIEALAAMQPARAVGSSAAPQLPSTLEELGPWADRELAGRLTIHSRAIRGAKKSDFRDIPLVYKALLLLANEYRDMRVYGGPEHVAAFATGLQELGLKEEPSFAGAGAHLEGDTYFVTHRGRPRELNRHLKGSNSRQEQYCLRIYFFWDTERGEVVVGWLPSHLDTRAT
jgi:hypothetical protein